MCGRYTLQALPVDISARFSLAKTWFTLAPRYNIAPSQSIAAVIRTDDGHVLVNFRWGLIPFWAKDTSAGQPLINARAETIATKAAFRQAFRQRRCLIPADGFYEWTQRGAKRQPVYIRLKSKALFALAGIWEEKPSPAPPPQGTCAIITVPPNDFLKPIHNRMPAILPPSQESTWLDPATSPDALSAVLQPYPSHEMESYDVSTRVNSPHIDEPKCLEPMTTASHWFSLPAVRPAALLSLDLPRALRLAVVGPHPDDFDAMGATLRFFRDRGDTLRAVVCHTSSGVEDSFCSPPTRATKQALREQEQRESLRFFGLPDGHLVFLDLDRDPSDNDQPFDHAINQARLAEAILPFQPHFVFLPHGQDTNSGHRKIYALVTRLLRDLGLSTVAWLVRDPKTVSFRTDVYLPFDEATAHWKAELLRFHRSQQQRNLNTRGHGFDERILAVNRQLARDLGLAEPYAEAFELQSF